MPYRSLYIIPYDGSAMFAASCKATPPAAKNPSLNAG